MPHCESGVPEAGILLRLIARSSIWSGDIQAMQVLDCLSKTATGAMA